MFKKLDVSIGELKLTDLRGPQSADYGPFREYKIKNLDYLIEEVNKHINFSINPTDVNITSIVHPGSLAHKDHWPVVLNYYFNPSNDVTYWWEQTQNFIEDEPAGATNYKLSNLKEIGSFVAQKNDLYLLNTKVVHSVSIRKTSAPRFILKFGWEHGTFDEILNSITPRYANW